MLLSRRYCCLVSVIVIVAAMFGQSTAQQNQNSSNTIIIDLRSPASQSYSRTIVVPRVPVLRFVIPEFVTDGDGAHITPRTIILDTQCSTDEYNCQDVKTGELETDITSFQFIYTLNGQPPATLNVEIDQNYQVGCTNYMHPQNATINGDVSPGPVTLTCEPVPVNPGAIDNEGSITIEWRRFTQLEKLQDFIQNCSNSSADCSNYFRDKDHFINNSSNFTLSGYNLTVVNPARYPAWFIPSFTVDGNHTYLAPYTFLYRWPMITSHYEFSLEITEPASNYNGLRCVAKSFPPIKAFVWTRDGTNIGPSSPRYQFSNDTTGDQITAIITITEVTFEDSALFTCLVGDFGNLLKTDVSLSVRLRVRHRLRPLWPALGIIGVGILVSVFIIIGHFWDKAIEKFQNEPSNPSHHKRLQSITSTADETLNNVPSGKKQSRSQADQVKYTVGDHTAVKRLSSARIQLLEEPQ